MQDAPWCMMGKMLKWNVLSINEKYMNKSLVIDKEEVNGNI